MRFCPKTEHSFARLRVFRPVGEVTVQGLGLPLPGLLRGMPLLFAGLQWHGGLPEALQQAANALLRHLMLLFIPVVTGVSPSRPRCRSR